MVQDETSPAELESQAIGDSPENLANDRRRAGRLAQVNPTLVPLLRGDLPADALLGGEIELVDSREDLAPAVGIAVAIGASTLLWTAIGFAARAVLR